jgi:L-fuculose-phosphate aldolase
MMYEAERQSVALACRTLMTEKLVVGTAGNVSIRLGDHIVISPSGFDYAVMSAEHVVVTDFSGEIVEGDYKPSSELPLHIAVYESSDHKAIAHTHAVSSTALSTVVDEVPASHYYTALFGGSVRVAPYATYGSTELALNVKAAMANRSAALMSNHGAVSAGPTLSKAMDQLAYLEYICEVQLKAMATGHPIKVLPNEEIEKVVGMLSGYGQAPKP